MRHSTRVAIIILLCGWAARPGEAASDNASISQARSYYEKGDAAYNLGRFGEAVSWFTKAYETWPFPDFLYNIAQAYRQAGNCKQALFAYKRYLSLKDKDQAAPLALRERADIERFIKDLTDCVAKADSSAAATPDALKTTPGSPSVGPSSVGPPPGASPPAGPSPAGPVSPSGAATAAVATAAAGPAEVDADLETAAARPAAGAPRQLYGYAAGGVAIFGTGGALDIPTQPSIGVGGGYPLPVGPVTLDLGARVSFSPLQYDAMDGPARASLLGMRATVGATYPLNAKLSVHGEFGAGIALLRGLVDGNPFTASGGAGSFTMPSVRLGLGAEYAITPHVSASVSPLGMTFSRAPDALFFRSLAQLEVLLGVGYRR